MGLYSVGLCSRCFVDVGRHQTSVQVKLAVAFVILIAIPGIADAQVDSLSSRSQRVATGVSPVMWDYVWINDSETVWWQALTPPLVVRSISGPGQGDADGILTATFDKYVGGFVDKTSRHFLYRLTPSPDGKRILALECVPTAGLIRFHVMSGGNPDATVMIEADDPNEPPIWSSNSTALVIFVCTSKWAQIRKWQLPEVGLTAGAQVIIDIKAWHYPANRISWPPELVGFTPEGGGIALEWARGYGQQVLVYDIDAAAGTRKTRKYAISPPHHGTMEGISLSPQGDRLAWTVFIEDTRIGPAARIGQPQSLVEIWTSKVDGTDMRLIGGKTVRHRGPHEGSVDDPDLIRWTPDGKRLSYVLGDSLWIVDVAPGVAGN